MKNFVIEITPEQSRDLYDALWQALHVRRESQQRGRDQNIAVGNGWPLVENLITTIDIYWKEKECDY